MSTEPIRITRKEFSSEEIINRLDDGQRVLVTVGVLGVTRDVTLRKNGDEYVCDTGVKLMTYDDRDDMKNCIERLKLAEPE